MEEIVAGRSVLHLFHFSSNRPSEIIIIRLRIFMHLVEILKSRNAHIYNAKIYKVSKVEYIRLYSIYYNIL